ncbi:MAG TPA: ribonuclease J [Candidatus Fimihabitans intestinipullorum]|uniref:Ribonuclease J n=1 Tax=Candidatus Fimihabitans intestinipullorum TaxID=2840820 RepID=A0A9D1L3W9_9BACT|nr:ribonuclease J [Candidatus Fimihabitans intestinipullorum]
MKLFDNNHHQVATKIFALGGLGEVGKNMYCVMHGNELVITDAGITFPGGELMGIDYVIPDFTFLKKNEKKIKALFITHGHEDHIGGIPFLLQTVNIPVIYAPNQAVGLIRKKLDERNIQYKNLIVYDEKTKVKFKNIEVEFFRTTHSIPDSHGICITTPNGIVVTTGDFKFDLTPIGPMANIHKMAEIGSRGVTLLMSDSTNALNEGMSMSESKVDNALQEIFKKHHGRIIIATFASNIYRLKHIVETCHKNGRKIATFGRSMDTNIDISIQGGYIKNKDIFITPEEANHLPDHKVCLLCTGSQGEPLAALSRIANGTHRQIKLKSDDVVVFSSSPIPGNALSISRTINKLYLRGVEVYTNTSLSDIHTSGHGSQEELKLMLRLIKPKYFMPFHGEYRMLKQHADLGVECDIPKKNTFVLGNGDVLSMYKGKIERDGTVQAGDVYVDGNRIGDVGGAVIKDRKIMANDGIVIVICNIDTKKKMLLSNPNITTRGFVLVNDNIALLHDLEHISKRAIELTLKDRVNYSDMKSAIMTELTSYIYEKTGRKPIILPVIMDIKRNS